jgi:hypothetical protein
MKCRSISSVTSKSAITPSFSGRIAEIVPGVRPSIRFASMPTAWTSPVRESTATTLGSDSTIPRPRTYTSVFAVPRSTAMSRPPKPVRYPKKPITNWSSCAAGAVGAGQSSASAERVRTFRRNHEMCKAGQAAGDASRVGPHAQAASSVRAMSVAEGTSPVTSREPLQGPEMCWKTRIRKGISSSAAA